MTTRFRPTATGELLGTDEYSLDQASGSVPNESVSSSFPFDESASEVELVLELNVVPTGRDIRGRDWQFEGDQTAAFEGSLVVELSQ